MPNWVAVILLMNNLVSGSTKVCERSVLRCLSHPHKGKSCTRVGRYRAPAILPLGLWVACGWGAPGFVVFGGEGSGSGIQSVKRHRIDRGEQVQA